MSQFIQVKALEETNEASLCDMDRATLTQFKKVFTRQGVEVMSIVR